MCSSFSTVSYEHNLLSHSRQIRKHVYLCNCVSLYDCTLNMSFLVISYEIEFVHTYWTPSLYKFNNKEVATTMELNQKVFTIWIMNMKTTVYSVYQSAAYICIASTLWEFRRHAKLLYRPRPKTKLNSLWNVNSQKEEWCSSHFLSSW